MIALRRAVWPLREVLGALQRGESSLIQAGTIIYLRDVYDHTIQIIDTDREHPRHSGRHARHLPLSDQQPAERGHEGADDFLGHFHPADVSGRCLRNEFSLLTGVVLAVGIWAILASLRGHRRHFVDLFPAEAVVVALLVVWTGQEVWGLDRQLNLILTRP